MMKFYEVGWHKASIQRMQTGVYETVIRDTQTGMAMRFLFKSEVEALREILSYAEIDQDDFEEEQE